MNKIKIKPSHKGLFTKYCHGKVTQECINKGKSSDNPVIRKRATFADNARHFKHNLGGILKAQWGANIFVDTRSDTTRQGYHEGRIPQGAGRGSAGQSPLSTLISFLDYNPKLDKNSPYYDPNYVPPITGVAPTPTTIRVPQGMTGEMLSDITRASRANPAFNAAERLAQQDFQKMFGSGMPIATRRGRLALKDAFGNDVKYPKKITVQPAKPVVLKEGVTGRQMQKLSKQEANQRSYRNWREEKLEDESLGLSRQDRSKSNNEVAFASGDMRHASQGRPRIRIKRNVLTEYLAKGYKNTSYGKEYETILRNHARKGYWTPAMKTKLEDLLTRFAEEYGYIYK